jgi:hypothetical protein
MVRAPLPHGYIRGTITKTVLAYCEAQVGTSVAEQMAAKLAAQHRVTIEELRSSESSMSHLVVEDLYLLAVDATGDADAVYKAGLFSPHMHAIGVFLFGVVKMMGGPRFVYQRCADLMPRFANTGVMTCKEVTQRSALVEFQMYADLPCTLLGFDYRRGVLASVPGFFGQGQFAHIVVQSCQAKGDAVDTFRCRW